LIFLKKDGQARLKSEQNKRIVVSTVGSAFKERSKGKSGGRKLLRRCSGVRRYGTFLGLISYQPQ
jgi:hypothetical protein